MQNKGLDLTRLEKSGKDRKQLLKRKRMIFSKDGSFRKEWDGDMDPKEDLLFFLFAWRARERDSPRAAFSKISNVT